MSDEKKSKDKKRKRADEATEEAPAEAEPAKKEKKPKKQKSEESEAAAEAPAEAAEGEGKEEKVKQERIDPSTIKGGISVIANPLAGPKLAKKTLKLVKKAAAAKAIRRGVKEVVKALRKNEKGLMVIAGNITPIDVITHIPVLCEDKEIPYIFVPAKEDLGSASQTKRPTSCILVTTPKADADYKDTYDAVVEEVRKVAPVW